MQHTRHLTNRSPLDPDSIAEMVVSYNELINQGVTRNYILTSLREKRAISLRRGTYINAREWETFDEWSRYYAQLIALAKVSPQTLFSHQSAALLHGLWLTGNPPEKIHVYSSPRSRGSSRGVVKHPFLNENVSRYPTASGLSATSVVQTVIDCARSLHTREAVIVADSALYLKKVSEMELRSALSTYSGHQQARVHRVAQLMSSLAESPGETGVRLLLDEIGLEYVEQHQIQVGYKRYRVDLFIPELNLIIEFDGELKYTAFGDRSHVETLERSREKELQNQGYFVYRTNWATVFHQPQRFKREIQALAQTLGRGRAASA